MKVKVRVFLNRETDEDGRLAIFARSRVDGSYYREGDEMEMVFEYDDEFDTTGAVLNRAFAKFNRGSDTFVGDDAYPHRSVSVGDVVEVNGVRFATDAVGFTNLEEEVVTR